MPYGIKKEIIKEIKNPVIPKDFDKHCMNFEGDDLFLLKGSWAGERIVDDEAVNKFAEEFKAKTLQAKALIDNKEELPEDLKAFEGKIK